MTHYGRAATPRTSATERISLTQAVDVGLLKAHWKRIRGDLRAPRVTRYHLAADPLDWLQFEWQLEQRLVELRTSVLAGTYRATQPEVIRSAKGLGLTRPTAHFGPEHILLYRNIVALADNDLMRSMRPWTRFGRSDARNANRIGDPESGWFRAWLARNGQLWTITQTYDWLVETDISNFFPSVQLDTASSHVLAQSRLGVDVVRLLTHILRESAPLAEYRVSPVVGLPQDTFDCSRIIAHSLLGTVDDEFLVEGTEGRYSRYMDDIVVGVRSRQEGYAIVGRAQRSLERLGLYPNTAKTRVVRRTEFEADFLKGENDYLGEVETSLSEGTSPDLGHFRLRLRGHLKSEVRPRAWERVLRRYYRTSRILRDTTLMSVAAQHLLEHPGSSRAILDYVSTYKLTSVRVARLAAAVADMETPYEDVSLLALQAAVVAPVDRDRKAATALAEWGLEVVDRRRIAQARMASAAVLLVGKFGTPAHVQMLEDLYRNGEPAGDLFRRQLMVVLLGHQAASQRDLAAFAVESEDARRMTAYLLAVREQNERASGLLLGALRPRERREPSMLMIPPRMMFLASLLSGPWVHRLDLARQSWRVKLGKVSGPRDRVGEQWLHL